jgi:hypothetical protein
MTVLGFLSRVRSLGVKGEGASHLCALAALLISSRTLQPNIKASNIIMSLCRGAWFVTSMQAASTFSHHHFK